MRDLPLPTFPFAALTAPAAARRSIFARIDQAWRLRRDRSDQRERNSAKYSTAPHSHAPSGGRVK